MKRKQGPARGMTRRRPLVLAPPSADDMIGLLQAWRVWLVAGLVGALLGAVAYAAAPPPHRATATVNVDFHMELAWPQSTDREQFYYLERETRKLIEIAMSDAVFSSVASSVPGSTVPELRSGILKLSQPGIGGWHFFADHRDAALAGALARAWAQSFVDAVRHAVAASSPGGLERYITADVVQAESLPPDHSQEQGWYILAGAAIALVLAATIILFLRES